MKKIYNFLIISFLLSIFVFSIIFSQEKKEFTAPSIETLKGVINNKNSFIIFGDTKSFTQTSDDWFFIKIKEDKPEKITILSGNFSDKIIDAKSKNNNIIAAGNTWSFRRESLDDILVSILDDNLNLQKLYVVSGVRDDKVSKVITFNKDAYILASTQSVGFGSLGSLILKLDQNLEPSDFWFIGSNNNQESVDLISLPSNKYLLVGNYNKIIGNKDCLLSVLDSNFNPIRSFAFGGGFDENVLDTLQFKNNLYLIIETRSFKPQEKTNILISAFNKNNINHVRSFSFGTLEDDKYLSSYIYEDNIYIFFTTTLNKLPTVAVAIIDFNLNLRGVYNLNYLLDINSKVTGLLNLNNYLWVANLLNVNTLDNIVLIKNDKNIFDLLSSIVNKESNLNNRKYAPKYTKKEDIEKIDVFKYYLKISKYPNIELYPVELKSQKINNDNFIISNDININYFEVSNGDLWK